ncbi:exonuclease 1 [Rhododendron vialii]|uniref:exonuclease 1 n=1 Tax=Rhododendron vialii TaxID=182163 RepID=UPI00265EA81D|nr:exonuclease 1 [Rhododendron vialii]
MGIKDLLRFMKPYIEPIHIKKYAGKRVGIDAYSWLHKGAYSCSMEICLNTEGDKKFQYLNYFMHRINLLRHHNIVPVVVFDGGDISCKDATGQERSRKRKANLDLAMEKLKEGNRNAASELFQRAVSITPSMAYQLIQILRSEDIEFVVAPYEADAQLAYLSSLEPENGGIIAVISEDSDLLAYGCPAIVFKMDRYGNGEEILLHKVFESATCVPSFRHFDKELFIGMCVLAGCDFLPSVPGIGIAKAYSLVSKYRDLDRVLSMLKFEKGRQMPEDYPESFRKAVAVFQHARIYDADSESLKHMIPLPEKLLQSLDGDLDFLGPGIPPSIAAAIAKGNLDPTTMEAFDHFPSSRPHMNPSSKIHAFGTLLRQEATAVSKSESCFSIISSHKTGKEKSKGKFFKPT